MKGGKQGRKRRSASGGGPGRGGRGAGAAKKDVAKRQWSDAPKKGGKGKPEFGGLRTAADD
jgi:hypothetical protein